MLIVEICSPVTFEGFARSANSLFKCRRYIAIATVAHVYEATVVAEWGMERAFSMLETHSREFALDTEVLVRLYLLTERWKEDADIELHLMRRVRNIWHDAMYSSTLPPNADPTAEPTIRDCDGDPISILLALRPLQGMQLEFLALFYILARGDRYILRNQHRLQLRDRLSLMCGDRALSGSPFSEVQTKTFNAKVKVPKVPDPPHTRVAETTSTTTVSNGIVSSELQVQIERKWGSNWRSRVHSRLKGMKNIRVELSRMFDIEPWSLQPDKR